MWCVCVWVLLAVLLCSVVDGWGIVIYVCDACSWWCSFMSNVCVSSYRLVSVAHPITILNAVFCVICSC